jgi:hypothetical protein
VLVGRAINANRTKGKLFEAQGNLFAHNFHLRSDTKKIRPSEGESKSSGAEPGVE